LRDPEYVGDSIRKLCLWQLAFFVQLGVFTYYVRKDYLRDPVNVGDSIRKPKIIT